MSKLIKNKTNAQLKRIAFGNVADSRLQTDAMRSRALNELIKRTLEEAYDKGFAAGEKYGIEMTEKIVLTEKCAKIP